MATQPIVPTGNPILDNPMLKNALAAQMAAKQAPPPPAMMPPANLDKTPIPSLPTSTPAPVITGPKKGQMMQGGKLISLGTPEGDELERQRLMSQGSGISQIANRIEDSGLGQKHPILGKVLGIGAEGLAQLGNIALDTTGLGRNLAYAIPGTEQHHELLLNQANAAENQDVANQARQAQIQSEEAQRQNVLSQIPLHQAQTEEAQSEIPFRQAEERRFEQEAQQAQPVQLGPAMAASLGHPEWANETVSPGMLAGLMKTASTNQTRQNIAQMNLSKEGHTAFDEWQKDPQNYAEFEKFMHSFPSKSGGRSAGFSPYAGIMALRYATNYNPALLPVASQMVAEAFRRSGVNLTPEQVEEMAQIPEGQPISEETGNPIGTAMPEAPTNAIRTSAQAADTLEHMIHDNILPNIDAAAREGDLGPISGRIQDFQLRHFGDPNSAAAKLQATLHAVPAMLGRMYGFHSAQYAQAMNGFLNTRMTPDALKSYLSGVTEHARTVEEAQRGYEETGRTRQNVNANQNQPTAPKVGTVESGYRFKGGNPADPNSWEKVK